MTYKRNDMTAESNSLLLLLCGAIVEVAREYRAV